MRMKKITLVIATRNKDKLAEIRRMLRGEAVSVRSLDDMNVRHEVIEDRPTFEGNARKKAREYSQRTRTLALADDSGLMVRQLKGAPGVLSARYAGPGCSYEDNCRKVLRKLAGLRGAKRDAKFICVMALYDKGRSIACVRGECRGRITERPAGKKGFGYDPIFLPAGGRKTFSELSPVRKNAISHRGRALKRARRAIHAYLSRKAL